jgi:hypothetical protein
LADSTPSALGPVTVTTLSLPISTLVSSGEGNKKHMRSFEGEPSWKLKTGGLCEGRGGQTTVHCDVQILITNLKKMFFSYNPSRQYFNPNKYKHADGSSSFGSPVHALTTASTSCDNVQCFPLQPQLKCVSYTLTEFGISCAN